MLTFTGAWSRCPAAPGWISRTVTATVASGPPELPPGPGAGAAVESPAEAAVATVDTEAITPGVVVVPSGRVTVTGSPARSRYSWPTGTAAVTTGTMEVAVS